MNDSEKSDPAKPGSGLVGFVSIATCAVGVAGLMGAVGAVVQLNFVGVGVCLIAAALGFGLMLNALLRN